MNTKLSITLVVTLCFVILWIFALPAVAEEVPRITKEEVIGMLGNSNVVIIDVRVSEAWESSRLKIRGAVREDPKIVSSWMENYPKERILVFYCA